MTGVPTLVSLELNLCFTMIFVICLPGTACRIWWYLEVLFIRLSVHFRKVWTPQMSQMSQSDLQPQKIVCYSQPYRGSC